MQREPERPDDRVRRALAQLGADSESAPDVPAAVTARIGAALRAAAVPPAHTVAAPRLSRKRLVAFITGIAAIAAAAAVGVAALLHSSPTSRFPTGPTADRITVSVPKSSGDTPNPMVRHP